MSQGPDSAQHTKESSIGEEGVSDAEKLRDDPPGLQGFSRGVGEGVRGREAGRVPSTCLSETQAG